MTNEIGHSTHLFYYVGLRRKDGNPPTLEKMDGQIFLFYEDADKHLQEMDENVREYFSVFVAIACIPHIPPVTKEVGLGQPWHFNAEFTNASNL